MSLERWLHLLPALIPLAWLLLPAIRIGRWIQLESAAANRILAVPICLRTGPASTRCLPGNHRPRTFE